MAKHQSHFLSSIITGLLGLIGFALVLTAGGIFYASLDLFGTELGFTLVLVSAIFLVGGAIMLALVVLCAKIQALTLRLQPLPAPIAPIKPSLANIVATPPVLINPVPINPGQANDGTLQKEFSDEAAHPLPDRQSLDDKIATELAKLAKTAAPTLPLVTNKVDVTNLDKAGEAASLLPAFMRTRGQGEHKNEPAGVQEPAKEPSQAPIKAPVPEHKQELIDKPELEVTQEPSLDESKEAKETEAKLSPDIIAHTEAKPTVSETPIAPTVALASQNEPSLEEMSFEEKLARLANIPLTSSAPASALAPLPNNAKALTEDTPVAATPITEEIKTDVVTDTDAGKESINASENTLSPDIPKEESEDADKDDVNPDNAAKIVGEYHSSGTHYIMFSDGSIEAQSQAGVFRFASMDDLRAFIAEQSKGV